MCHSLSLTGNLTGTFIRAWSVSASWSWEFHWKSFSRWDSLRCFMWFRCALEIAGFKPYTKNEKSLSRIKREKSKLNHFHCSPNFGCNVTGRLTALMTAMRLEFGWTVPIEDISRSLTSLLGQMIWKWPIRNWIKSGHNSIWMWSSSVSMRFKFEIPEKRSTWINEVLWCLR